MGCAVQADLGVLEEGLGFPLFQDGEDRLGWLMNYNAVRHPQAGIHQLHTFISLLACLLHRALSNRIAAIKCRWGTLQVREQADSKRAGIGLS